ncbi:MAG: hypothetical protein NT129_00300 [Candidatus Aenigmarchaeota archaeon]|nr:hypothetical protein [Candidatus Aenigmarchaeota archaeon]
MMHHYKKRLEEAENVSELFDMVKEAVKETIGELRGGLNLGLMELGNGKAEWLGAFHPVGSNVIVMNKTPIRRIIETEPELMKPYLFHVILHEYLHSLGFLDEHLCRVLTYKICASVLGSRHIATEMCRDISRFIPYLIYPGGFPQVDKDPDNMDIIDDLDQEDDFYIG